MVIGHVSTNLEKVWMHRWRRFFFQSLKCLASLGGQEKLTGWLKKVGRVWFLYWTLQNSILYVCTVYFQQSKIDR